MSSQRELSFKSETATNEKEKISKSNNGYAVLMLPTLEGLSNKLSSENNRTSSYIKSFVKLTQKEIGVCLLVAVLGGLIFSTLPEYLLHSTCSLLKYSSRILQPGITVVSVFYWSSITVQKYFDSQPCITVMPVFLLTEMSTQVLLYFTDSRNIMAYLTVLTILTYSIVLLLPDFQNEGTYIFTLLLMLSNVFDRMVAGHSQTLLRYILINCSACFGEALTRLTEPQSSSVPTEIEARVSMSNKNSMKMRRSSSASSTGSSNRRRVSLPSLGFQTKSTVDATTLGEAHGMLSDLLADSSLPSNVSSTLKVISTMLAQPSFNTFPRVVNPMSPLVEKRYVPDDSISSKICEQPDMRDDVQIQTTRSRPVHFAMTSRRMSNLWTTTTSATGMPTVERETSSSLPNSIPVPGSPRSGSPTTIVNSSKLLGRVKSLPHNIPHASEVSLRSLQSDARTPSPVSRKSPSITENTFQSISTEKPKEKTCDICGCLDTRRNETESGKDDKMSLPCTTFSGKPKPSVDVILDKAKSINHDDEYHRIYDKIDTWNFPIFDAWPHGNVLRGVAYKVFKKSGFFEKFMIDEQIFLNFFTALEAGYNDIPYHNSVHAADVLHGVYYFTTQKIAGFCPTVSVDCDSDSDSTGGDQPEETGECVDHYDRLTSCFPDLERFALYSAAAMHDYDHPGRTNAFLVATLAPQALLYNDRSVLENHHAAQAFTLLLSDERYNFVENLTTTDFKRFRFLVIEAVLATDLKRHFDVLQEFNGKVASGSGIDWSLESDRLLASQVCIKMADISGPSKQKDIHTRWTERIVEEFYEQGDDEFAKSLPVSRYMERQTPLVAQLQESFINHLVQPLFQAYRDAGLMPGSWITLPEYENQDESESDSSPKDEESTELSDSGVGNACNYPRKKSTGKKKKFRRRKKVSKTIHCEILDNIETNYQMWVRRVKEQEIEKQSSGISKNKELSKAEEEDEEEELEENEEK